MVCYVELNGIALVSHKIIMVLKTFYKISFRTVLPNQWVATHWWVAKHF